jgi:hypothetical protein
MRHVRQNGRNLASDVRGGATKLRPRSVVVVGPKTVQPEVVVYRGRISGYVASSRCVTNGRRPTQNKIEEVEVGGPS